MNTITNIGSISVDNTVITTKRPKAGETVVGTACYTTPGGKGANQAVAASLLGGNVRMIGAVGNDANGMHAMENLKKNNVDTENITVLDGIDTGTAYITVADGDNSIVIIPGANKLLTPDIVKKSENVLLQSSLIMTQLEIPMDTIFYIADLCHSRNIPLLLNPAPAVKLDSDLINKVSWLTPNEHEFITVFDNTDIYFLLKKFPKKLIITQGAKGVSYCDDSLIQNIPAQSFTAVDTTGAGDTFNGAFAVAMNNHFAFDKAIEFANIAAGLSITKLGAQSGMPSLNEVYEYFHK